MKNILAPRCLSWSALQVVVFVVCYRGRVSSAEFAQGCIESRLSLECPEMKVISVSAVVLGDSSCIGTGCCIKDNDCTHSANERHTNQVHRGCNGQRRCIVKVFKEKIPCGYWYAKLGSNDFERITYNCVDDPRNDTTNSTDVTYIDSNTDDDTTSSTDVTYIDNNTYANSNPVVMSAVMVAICLTVLIAAVVLVAMIRRRQRLKSWAAVNTSNAEHKGKDFISANEAQGTSQNRNADSSVPIYLDLYTPSTEQRDRH